MGLQGIDTIAVSYDLQECGISRSNVIDAMHTKKESWQYETGGTDVKYTEWKGDFISKKEHRIKGYMGDTHLTIYGSLPKFIQGNNFEGISVESATKVIDDLSETIGASLYGGKVTRVDYASNYFMNHNPKLYYKFFGNSHKFKRLEYPTNIAWKGTRNQARYKTIEDKTAWAKETKNEIPKDFHDKHIIRYENRLTSANRIAHVLQMGGKYPTLKDVLSYDGILNIHLDFKRQYNKIEKRNNLIDYSKYMQKKYYTPAQAHEVLYMALLQEANEMIIDDFMKYMREEKKLGTGQIGYNNTSSFKKKINALRSSWIRNNNDMMKELDEKVNMTEYM